MSDQPDHYDTLGVGRNASAAEIKRAYKKKAHKAHPDKGGKTEDFQRLHQAYFTLSDNSRRERYDQTGEDAPKNDPRAEMQAYVVSLFLSAVDALDESKTNIIEALRDRIKSEEANGYKDIRELDKKTKKNERALSRLKKKSAGPNLIALALEEKIRAYKKALVLRKESLSKFKLAHLILDDYEYQADIAKPGEYQSFAERIESAVRKKR